MQTESKLVKRISLGLFFIVSALFLMASISMIKDGYSADLKDKTGFNQEAMPVGAILAMSGVTGGMAIPASGTVNAEGWMVADGSAIPAGNTATGNTPDLTNRFIRGDATAGATGGADSDSITLAEANLPSHVHEQNVMNVTTNWNKNVLNSDQIAHSHAMQNHTHGMSHTHSINHDHAQAATDSDGAHSHTRVSSRNGGGSSALNISSPSNGSTTIGSFFNNTWNLSVRSDGSNHSHQFDMPNFVGTSGAASSSSTGGPSNNTSNTSTATWSSSNVAAIGTTTNFPDTDPTGSGTAFNVDTLPAYYAVVYLIKVR